MTLKTTISEGQEYFDEAVYAEPKKELLTPIAEALAMAFGHVRPVLNKKGRQVLERTDVKPLLLGYERVRLKWVMPDGTPKERLTK